MSLACTRPKGTNDNSPQKPRLQKVEREEKSPSSSRGKQEGGTEQASMKNLLEQANKMLKSLTAPASTTSKFWEWAKGWSSGPASTAAEHLETECVQTESSVIWQLSRIGRLWSHTCSSPSATGWTFGWIQGSACDPGQWSTCSTPNDSRTCDGVRKIGCGTDLADGFAHRKAGLQDWIKQWRSWPSPSTTWHFANPS